MVALGRRRENERVLDPDDLCSEISEKHSGVGTRPHHGQVHYPDAFEGRAGRGRGRPGRDASGAAASDFTSPVCWPGVGAARRRAQPPSAKRHQRPGQVDGPADRVVRMGPEVALVKVIRLEDLTRAVHPGQRPPRRLRLRRRFRPRPGQEPGIDGHVEYFLGFEPLEGVGALERRRGCPVAQHPQHLVELLCGRHQGHVAVGTREDTGRDQRRGRTRLEFRWRRDTTPVLVAEEVGLTGRHGRQRFERRAVHEVPGLSVVGRHQGGQASNGGNVADEVEDDVSGEADRVLFGRPLSEQGTAHGLDDDVLPPVVRVRTGRPEAADMQNAGRRSPAVHTVPVHVPVREGAPTSRFDDQIGSFHQGVDPAARLRVGRVQRHAALVGVQVQCEAVAAGGSGFDGRVLGPARYFHLHHVGAQVGEELPAVGRRDSLTQLDHRNAREGSLHAAR